MISFVTGITKWTKLYIIHYSVSVFICTATEYVFQDNLFCFSGVDTSLKWTNLNPRQLIETLKNFKYYFPYETIEDLLDRVCFCQFNYVFIAYIVYFLKVFLSDHSL